MKRDMDTIRGNSGAMNEKLKGVGESLTRNKTNVKEDVIAKVEPLQEQLNKQEESNRRLEAEIKKSLNEIMKQLQRITQQTSHKVQAEERNCRSCQWNGQRDKGYYSWRFE